jgi:hypothetical protein
MSINKSAALFELGLKSDATWEDIRRTYRDLVKVWHPDRFPGDAELRRKSEDRLKRITAAYETLRILMSNESGVDVATALPAAKPQSRPNPSSLWTVPIIAASLGAIVIAALVTLSGGRATGTAPAEPSPSPGDSALAEDMVATVLDVDDSGPAIEVTAVAREDLNEQFSQGMRILFTIKNSEPDSVRALRGFVTFNNPFGERVAVIFIEATEIIPPGSSVTLARTVSVSNLTTGKSAVRELYGVAAKDWSTEWNASRVVYVNRESYINPRPYLESISVEATE